MSKPTDSDDRGDKHGWRRLGAFFHSSRVGAHSAGITGIKGMLRSVGPMIVVALILAGFGVAFASQAGHGALSQTADSGATATASSLAPVTDTPSDTTSTATTPSATQASSGSSTQSSSSSSAPSSAPTPDAFHIQSMTVTADPADNFTHTCSAVVNESFTMTIVVDPNGPGETITYGWDDLWASSATQHTGSLTFAPGETSKTVTFQMGFNAGRGDGTPQQDNAWVDYPDAWMWAPTTVTHATVAFTCVRQLTSLTLTPSISSWNAPCANSTPITMTWTVTASPGPRLLVDFSAPIQSNPAFGVWLAPNPFGAELSATSSPSETTTQASGVINTSLNTDEPNGTYWIQVATTAPAALTAKATVVKSC